MKYTPNFSDTRVHKRCHRALGFVLGVMSTTKPHSWSTRYIDRYLGVSSNDLSRYLRENLLICTDERYRFNTLNPRDAKCKEYILNESGVRELKRNLNLALYNNYPIVLDLVQSEYKQQLESGEFDYTDKSERLWHPLQRYRRAYKQQVLAEHGYCHQYDIATCAPTVIHQRAQQMGMDEYLPALRDYLSRKSQIRAELAAELELPESAVKEIINALFAGAVVSRHPESDISHIVAGDLSRIEYLKQNEFVCELRANIRTCWQYLRPLVQTRTRTTKSGRERLLPITSRQKWHLYFQLERRVMSCVRTYLDKQSMRYFLEHDGWTCESAIDTNSLRICVREQTGFDLNFDYAKI